MIQPPDISEKALATTLFEGYSIRAKEITFLPIGNDSSSWAYRADDFNGTSHFLKVRRQPVDEKALKLPRFLFEQGIHEAVAPICARDGLLWQAADRLALSVYPYISGYSGMEGGLSAEQWTHFGSILQLIHRVQLPADLVRLIPVETFHPKWSVMIRRVRDRILSDLITGPFETQMARFWKTHDTEIQRIVARTETIGAKLRKSALAFVLCHADIHTANLMVDLAGSLHIVDWDQPIFAPKERDLTFVLSDNPAGEQSDEERLFFTGYGQCKIDPLALAYYRYEWVVQELGDYGERVFFRADLGEETKAESVDLFEALFDPGDVVDAAYLAITNDSDL